MEEKFLGDMLKNSVEQIIREDIDKRIEEKVEEFKRELQDNKEQYIAEIMKGIRILHSQEPGEWTMNYKITFENVTRLEK